MIDIKALCNDVRAQALATPAVVSFPPVYELVIACAAYWAGPEDLRFVLRRAGLDPADYDMMADRSKSRWAFAFEKAWHRDELNALLDAIASEYPKGGFTPRTEP